ncbi:suppressor of fused domain protein [Botrimarina mediterranea]|uniref:Suppressor of fused protein (SUFU) n=1 Tax=Botrimarina mediterranea TaxID=2528022 RepID=A0A518KB17_9BACT|nr:suppressor of fused domain protein [Botrimarina mediterranea]QDV74986.1 Suppressor of fused protein (SUFU) [Botrimarina mediterranea]
MTDNVNDSEGAEVDAWYERKSELMASVLGKPEDWVMHAIIPYDVGGRLDQYFYRSFQTGTAMATKELSLLPDQGSSNDRLTTYEMVGFMRPPFTGEDAGNLETTSGRIYRRLDIFMNALARYSEQATLNPYETSAVPKVDESESDYPLVIFDEFAKFDLGDNQTFGLLAVIEIFPSEFEYKQENGGDALIDLLKQEGVYPFTDPNRSPVV